MPETAGETKQNREHTGHQDRDQARGQTTLVYATFPSADAARTVAREMVGARIAACVNVIERMTAVYEWQGTLHEDSEAIAIFKTRTSLAEELMGRIRQDHPYDNPAILRLDVSGGSQDFLDWIATQTSQAANATDR